MNSVIYSPHYLWNTHQISFKGLQNVRNLMQAYRDRPWSVVSEWPLSSHWLCRFHQCLNLWTNTWAPVSERLLSGFRLIQTIMKSRCFTSPFHRSDTLLHKSGDCGLLLCTQRGQMAPKDIFCIEVEHRMVVCNRQSVKKSPVEVIYLPGSNKIKVEIKIPVR